MIKKSNKIKKIMKRINLKNFNTHINNKICVLEKRYVRLYQYYYR